MLVGACNNSSSSDAQIFNDNDLIEEIVDSTLRIPVPELLPGTDWTVAILFYRE